MAEEFLKDVTQPFKGLDLFAMQVVEGFITGMHKSPFHGFSVEFAEHRQYNTGESVRHIDWKLYGRTDKLFVKRYEEETNLRANILIDISNSMLFTNKAKDTNKLQFSILAASALSYLLVKQRDAVGISTFDSKIRWQTEIKSSPTHLKYLFYELEKLLDAKPSPVTTDNTSTIAESLHIISEQMHKRSMIIIFSDMFETKNDQEALFLALQHLKFKKNEVIMFNVLERSGELDFDYANTPHKFVDLETGEEIKLNPLQFREMYQERVVKYREELKLRCQQYKIDFVDCYVEDGFVPVLQGYLCSRWRR